MKIINTLLHHLKHPFTLHKSKKELSRCEKIISYSGLSLAIFCVVPGFLAFYGISFYFKSRKVVNLTAHSSNSSKLIKTLSTSKSSSQTTLKSKSSSQTTLKSKSSSQTTLNDKRLKEINAKDEIKDILESLAEKDSPNVITDLGDLRVEVEKTILWQEYLHLMKEHDEQLFFNIFNNILVVDDEGLKKEFIGLMSKQDLLNFAKDFCNVQLKFDANKELAMNKALLVACSPYFKRMFQWGGTEQNLKELSIDEVTLKSFKQLIIAEITKNAAIDETNFQEMFELATRFECTFIKQQVAKWFLENFEDFEDSPELDEWVASFELENNLRKYILIDETNFEEMLALAGKFNFDLIKNDVANWVLENIEDFEDPKDMDHLLQLAVDCNAKELKKVVFEKLLFTGQDWTHDECNLIIKWHAHLDVSVFPKKLTTNELSLDNIRFLALYFYEDVYSDEVVKSDLFDFLFDLHNNQPNQKAEQLLIKWAPLITKFVVPGYVQMQNLRTLLPYFNNLQKLKIIKHSHFQVGDLNDKDMRLLPRSLTTLIIPSMQKITDRGYKHLPPNLKKLSLEDCSLMTDKALSYFPKLLEFLELKGATFITGKCIASLGNAIKFLNLYDCPNFYTIEGLVAQPERLYLSKCNMTDEGLAAIPDSVTHLDLSYNNRFTGMGVSFPNGLEVLRLGNCKKLIKPELLELNDNLQCLYLSGIISTKLKNRLTRCEIFRVF